MFIIQTNDARYLKFQVYPSTDLARKMSIGTVAFDEKEAMRLFQGLQAIFESRPLPDWIETKDLRNLQRVSAEYRVKNEPEKAAAFSAEALQAENLKTEGRLPQQELGEIAEVKKREVKP